MIEFARLINEAADEPFQAGIAGYLDMDEFLRFLAANALLSNLNSFFALGNNYALYLDPDGRFHFIPGTWSWRSPTS